MRKSAMTLLMAVLMMCSLTASGAKNAKYVFMFIGDGMGVNQVLATQMYLSELEGRHDVTPLCFTQFPATGLVLTYSASSGVTDSSASGTALSSGEKTANNAIGVLPDRKTPTKSIAERAHQQGKRVAICSSVGVDHATPGAYYAHRPSRNDYHQIGMQLAESGFDFFAGGDFHQNFDKRNPDSDEGNMAYAEKNGYTIVRGMDEYRNAAASSDKMILFEPEDDEISSLSFGIDQDENSLNIAKITTAAIDFMMKEPKKGFFMMVEGGRIDDSMHGQDAATCVREVIDFDNAIKVAYDFYLKHKDETLIVVTADHETGGIVLGNNYSLNLKALQYQKMSEGEFTKHIQKINKDLGEDAPLTWEEMQEELKKNFGFWDAVKLSKDQESRLLNLYVEIFGMNYLDEDGKANTDVEKFSDLAVKIMNEAALVGVNLSSHSAGYVPVFAIGKGSEQFVGQINNIDIPVKIANAAGIKW